MDQPRCDARGFRGGASGKQQERRAGGPGMTTPTSAPTTTGTGSSHSGASWVWLARITWRQHRWTITATTLAVAAVSAYFLVTAARLDRIPACPGGLDCFPLWDSAGPVLEGRH